MKNITILTLLLTMYSCGSDKATEFGTPGVNGYNSLVYAIPGAANCPNSGLTVVTGLDLNRDLSLDMNEILSGQELCNGVDGINGSNGSNGTNGINGINGQDAVINNFTPVAVINPCGNNGSYDEVLLRLSNGQVLASFSQAASGLNTRFALLPDGGFQTTDNTSCSFTLSTIGTQRCLTDSIGTQCWNL